MHLYTSGFLVAPPSHPGRPMLPPPISSSGTQYTLLDLFSGAGGFTLGFIWAGFTPIYAVDNNFRAAQTYTANFGAHCDTTAVEKVKSFPAADVIIGGPPCQGFSNLGPNDKADPRNQLWRHFVRAVRAGLPKVFVLENVPPLLKSAQGQSLLTQARRLGYKAEGRILNSADYGSPQLRKRTIIIGSRIGPVVFPPPSHGDPSARQGLYPHLQPWRTVRDAIGDLPRQPTGQDLHWGRNPTPKSLQRYGHIPPGGNRWDLPLNLMPDCWKRKTEGGTDLFGRLWWDRPSVTIRTEFFKPEKGRYLHPDQDRPITHREAARIQGFPDDFQFSGSKIDIARQIGNAVPVHLAHSIALAVRAMLDGVSEDSTLGDLPLFAPVEDRVTIQAEISMAAT